MQSYISSYFGAGAANSTAPQYGQYQPQYQPSPPPIQSGSTWTSTFSSRIGALRKALTKDNEEDDDEYEDCSHVSNVLRAYYIEKGRSFPDWLPPDPRKPVVTPVQQAQYGQYGNAYPGQYANNPGMPHSRANSGGRGGGLSDLWDAAPSQPQPQAQSLRAPRPTPQTLKSFDSSTRQSGSDPQTLARPLPSQRAGSHQNLQPTASPSLSGNPRDRLRARLQGGNSGRNSPANTSQAGHDSQSASSQSWSNDPNSHGSSGGYDNPSYQQRSGSYR